MSLVVIGFAVGVLAVFLLRTLVQIEKDGKRQFAENVATLLERTAHLEDRVATLEAIAAASDPVQGDKRTIDLTRLEDAPMDPQERSASRPAQPA